MTDPNRPHDPGPQDNPQVSSAGSPYGPPGYGQPAQGQSGYGQPGYAQQPQGGYGEKTASGWKVSGKRP